MLTTCTHCQRRMADEARFCPRCGRQVMRPRVSGKVAAVLVAGLLAAALAFLGSFTVIAG